MHSLTKFAVKRPVTVFLGLLTILYFGIQSLLGAKIELTPEMDMPVLVVATVYPGASPEDMNDLITVKQEDAVSSLDAIDSVTAASMENVSVLLIQYEYGTDIDSAYLDLKKAIDGIENDMPEDAEEPTIMEMDINAQPIVTLAVDGEVDGNLYTYVDEKIVPEIEKLSAVGEVSIAGGQKEYARIELIPEKLEQYHLSLNTVAQLVAAADFTIPAGDIEVGDQTLDVSVDNEYESTESLKDIVLPLANGETIHLSDIANVYDALEDESSIGRYNGKNVISLGVKKQQSATAIETSRQVLKQIEVLEEAYPGVHFTIINDTSEMIVESITNVAQTMIMAIVLSMIILFLFYGDLRASVIVGTSIPISVVVALICMSGMDFSLNVISLTSLVLGVGMMVDNSINVLDGCFRAREKLNFYEAAIEGSRVMISSIIGGTVTTCVVFIPLLLIDGMSGQMFTQLGYTIVFCMVASLLSAVIIVPLLYYLWHPIEKQEAPVASLLRSMQAWYRTHMPSVIRKTKMVFTVTGALVIAAVLMATQLKIDLMSTIDERIVEMTIKTKPGMSIASIRETVEELEQMVSEDENVDHYLLTYGDSGVSMTPSTDVTLSAYLVDKGKYSTREVIEQWRYETASYTDVTISIDEGSNLMPISNGGDSIEIDLESTDYDLLKEASDALVEELRKRDDVMQVHSSIENAAPVVKVRVDPVKAEAEGLTPAGIGAEVYSNLSGVDAAEIRVNGEDVDVTVEFAPDRYNSIDKLQGMMITTAMGTVLPLEDLAEIYYEDSPQTITRTDKQYQVAITMEPQAQYIDTAEDDVKDFVAEWEFPYGVAMAENAYDEIIAEEIGSLAGALITAIFLVFIVMGIQFESPKFSLMVMTTIPFTLIGSFGLLFLTGSAIDMVSVIGFLMLVGTVVNNGILYVDTVNQMLGEGTKLDTALVEAGAIRMRPILMTTLTTVISMLPNAFAFGKAGKMMQGMALVNVGGLTASTILTLFLLPTFYRVVYKLGKGRYRDAGEVMDYD